MKSKKLKLASAFLATSLLVTPILDIVQNNQNIAKAEQSDNNNNNNVFEDNIDLSKVDIEEKLKEAEFLLKNKQITQEEFNIIKMILKPENSINLNYSFRSNYYPEQKVAYINYWGIKEIYEVQLPRSKRFGAILNFLVGKLAKGPYGWGIGTLGLLGSLAGKSSFERAVEQAYWQKKGIDVYYQIHKGVMSLNRVRYVVI